MDVAEKDSRAELRALQEKLEAHLIARGASPEDANDAAYAVGLTADDIREKLGASRSGKVISLGNLLASRPADAGDNIGTSSKATSAGSPLASLQRAIERNAQASRTLCEEQLARDFEAARAQFESQELKGSAPHAPEAEERRSQHHWLVEQLPSGVIAMSNVIIRSALGAVALFPDDRRPFLQEKRIHALQGIEIRYTGPALNLHDIDTWDVIVDIARKSGSTNVTVTPYLLLKSQGKTDSTENRRALHAQIMRLKATAIDAQCGRMAYAGSLIDEVFRADPDPTVDRMSRKPQTREYLIRLNPRLADLFAHDQYTLVDSEIRRRLGKNMLARWLLAFYSSHAAPGQYRVETLHQLCGSGTQDLHKFAQQLKGALAAVQEASEQSGKPFSFTVVRGLVSVSRTPSATQSRHLRKKRASAHR